VDELVMACELGVFVLNVRMEDGNIRQVSFSSEIYMPGKLVSQVAILDQD
jgi:hypothetical protein